VKLRVGIIGAGMMGLSHVRVVRDEFASVELAAVFDPHEPSVRQAVEAAPSLKTCASADELLALDVDAVIISTPGFMHADDVERCLRAGKHVLAEKPVMTTRKGCHRMVELAEAHPDRVVMINHELRYASYFQKIKALIEAGEVGEVQLMWAREFRGPFLKKVGDWIQDSRYSGGSLVDMNSHHFDLMNWWANSRPARVSGFGGNDVVRVVNNEHEVIDHASVSFEYENGVRGGLLLCMFSPNTGESLEMGVMGSEGMIQTRLSRNEIWQWRRGSEKSEPIVHSVTPGRMGWGAPRGFYEAHETFFRAIVEKARPLTDVRACVDGTLLAIGAEEAIRSGQVVKVT
jgi:predicted dehydrogenase